MHCMRGLPALALGIAATFVSLCVLLSIFATLLSSALRFDSILKISGSSRESKQGGEEVSTGVEEEEEGDEDEDEGGGGGRAREEEGGGLSANFDPRPALLAPPIDKGRPALLAARSALCTSPATLMATPSVDLSSWGIKQQDEGVGDEGEGGLNLEFIPPCSLAWIKSSTW